MKSITLYNAKHVYRVPTTNQLLNVWLWSILKWSWENSLPRLAASLFFRSSSISCGDPLWGVRSIFSKASPVTRRLFWNYCFHAELWKIQTQHRSRSLLHLLIIFLTINSSWKKKKKTTQKHDGQTFYDVIGSPSTKVYISNDGRQS